jgi:hypothetical protein
MATKSKAKAKPKTPTEVNQENVRSFAFPTRKSMKAAAKVIAARKFVSHDRVEHKKYGEGRFVGYDFTLGSVTVLFDKEQTQGEIFYRHVKESSIRIVPTKTELPVVGISPTAEQVLKRDFGFIVGDRVLSEEDNDNIEYVIVRVDFAQPDVSDLLNVTIQKDAAAHEGEIPTHVRNALTLLPLSAKLVPVPKTKIEKIAFRDVVLFGAFSVKGCTFVKVGASTAIAACVKGSESEPFAMLATPNTKLAKSAKRSFKQGDKVLPYAA